MPGLRGEGFVLLFIVMNSVSDVANLIVVPSTRLLDFTKSV